MAGRAGCARRVVSTGADCYDCGGYPLPSDVGSPKKPATLWLVVDRPENGAYLTP